MSIPDALEIFYNRGDDKIKAEILQLPNKYNDEIKEAGI